MSNYWETPGIKRGCITAIAAAWITVACPSFASDQPEVRLEKLYESSIPALGGVVAGILNARIGTTDLVIVSSTNGRVVALDPTTGDELWRVILPTPAREAPYLLATPAKVGRILFASYAAQTGDLDSRTRFLVAAVDLRTGQLAAEFPTLELEAAEPANDGGTVVFNPLTQLSRAGLAHARDSSDELGMLYVPFGSTRDLQPWHGWLFEIDLDAWKNEGTESAVSSVLLTTPESSCPVEGERGGSDMICGAGIWSPAGPQVLNTRSGYELLVTTGNGALDLNARNYAQSVLRLSKGLDFDPLCHPAKCSPFDPLAPAEQCLQSCEKISIPRLLPDDPPLRVASGRCDGTTFIECLALNDWDLGASVATEVKLGRGEKVIVQPGKEGALYMFDAEHMGRMLDRKQIIPPCGVPGDECAKLSWMGVIRSQPVVVKVDGDPVVIIATFKPETSEPAGVIATKIVRGEDGPRFEPFWTAPDFATVEAGARFRGVPSLPVITKAPDGERYVWVVDTTLNRDVLFGIRVVDGEIMLRQQLRGRVDTVRPLFWMNSLYVTSKIGENGDIALEAFRIRY